jgi:Mrp family chromosome partitioning ATPase
MSKQPKKPAASRGGEKRTKRNTLPDGTLVLRTESQDVVHIAAPQVTESLRYMIGRARLREGTELSERIGFTSALSGEGVTFVTRSLALVLANDTARRVCIVDLNWWSPSPWPGDERPPGLAEILRDGRALEEVLLATGNEGISYLPSGEATVKERPLLANSVELERVLIALSEQFDHVLLDLPAVLTTSEALALSEVSGAVMLVVAQGVTPEAQLKAALDDLSGVRVLGAVLNRTSAKTPKFLLRRIPAA